MRDSPRGISAFPDGRPRIEDITAEGDKVWARVVSHATNTGPFMGKPATGKRVSVEIIDICRFADGKLVEHWGLTDRLSLMQQLGVIPAPGEVAQLRR
jgi:predicted ester cyclase